MNIRSQISRTVLLTLMMILSLAGYGCTRTVAKQTSREAKAKKDGLTTVVVETPSIKEKLDWKAYESFVNGVIADEFRDYFSASKFYFDALQRYPESYTIRISLAECYYRMQKFNDAIKVLEPITLPDINVYLLRGICYRSLGNNLKARRAYLGAIKFDSLNVTGFGFLSSEYRRLNQLDSLIWTYQHLLRIDDKSARLWNEFGQLQNLQGKYEDAKASFLNSLNLIDGRENLMAYVGLAETFQGLNQPDSATALLNEAIQLDPNNAYLNRELASHYSTLDSVELALQYAEKLTRLEPNNIAAFRYLALMYIRADSIVQGESILKELINAGDNEPGNYFYLGRLSLMKQDFETAKEYLTILTTLADTLADGWLDLGFVYRSQGDTAKSLNVYNSGLHFAKYKEDSVRLFFAIGATQERSNHIKEASQTFEKLLKLDPGHSQALNYWGYMLADRGEKLEYARGLIERALELSPKNAAYIDSYGWVMYRLGKYDSAVTYLEKAVATQSDPIIFDHLGDVYEAMGKKEDARIWWQKALELEPANDTIREKLNE